MWVVPAGPRPAELISGAPGASPETGQRCAIKMFKQVYKSWGECIALKEVSSLLKLKKVASTAGHPEGHPNIIGLIEVFRDEATCALYMVFEFQQCDLERLIRRTRESGRHLDPDQVNQLMRQLMTALEFVHHLYFHRDLKPENLMCDAAGTVLKLGDFGQARETRSRPPYTDYVSTRWYRAPEVQLPGIKSSYNSKVLIFRWRRGLGAWEGGWNASVMP